MGTYTKINALIETRINGNQIKGNKTYMNMLNSLRTPDFVPFLREYYPDHMYITRVYKKIDKIEEMVRIRTNGEGILKDSVSLS